MHHKGRLGCAILFFLPLSACAPEKSECSTGELTPEMNTLLMNYAESSRFTDDAEAFFAGYSLVDLKECGGVKIVSFKPKERYFYKGEEFSMIGDPIEFVIDMGSGRVSYEWID